MPADKGPDVQSQEPVRISGWHPSLEVPHPLPPPLNPIVEPAESQIRANSADANDRHDAMSPKESLERLREQLYASYPGDREKAARKLASLGSLARDALPDLESRLKDPSNGVRDAARLALLMIQRQAASASRPRWKEQNQGTGITVPQFLLTHYRSEIDTGALTRSTLRAADQDLYNALMNWRRRHGLPPELRNILSPRQHGKKVARFVEIVPEEAIAEIRAEIASIRAQMSSASGSNTLKAEINADISQIEQEIDRPAPRRSVLKIFLESLQENLAKAAGAAVAAGSIAVLGAILAKYFGVF